MRFLNDLLFIGCGGFLGAVCRYMISVGTRLCLPLSAFPIGTFIANMLGCFLIGLAAGLIEHKNWWPEHIRLMIMVGFLGGFTTYSSFANETWQLLKTDQIMLAFLNIGLKVMIGIFLVGLGYALAKSL